MEEKKRKTLSSLLGLSKQGRGDVVSNDSISLSNPPSEVEAAKVLSSSLIHNETTMSDLYSTTGRLGMKMLSAPADACVE